MSAIRRSPAARAARAAHPNTSSICGSRTQIVQALLDQGFAKTTLLITEDPKRSGLLKRVERANKMAADLFLSIHHDSVPKQFIEKWEYEGAKHIFSDRFPGHSIFISNDNADRAGSLLFGQLIGRELKTRGLQYTPHYVEPFMGNRRRVLVDADAGVYRFDQLVVLRMTRMPAVLLEAGSIIHRDEELKMLAPERRDADHGIRRRGGRELLHAAVKAERDRPDVKGEPDCRADVKGERAAADVASDRGDDEAPRGRQARACPGRGRMATEWAPRPGHSYFISKNRDRRITSTCRAAPEITRPRQCRGRVITLSVAGVPERTLSIARSSAGITASAVSTFSP